MFERKTLLKWKDPRFAYKYVRKQVSWKQWLLNFCNYIAIFAVIGLVIGFFVNLFSSDKFSNSGRDSVIFGVGGASFGIFFWIFGRLIDLKSPEISMYEKSISVWEPPDTYSSVAYQEIQYCSFVKNKIGKLEYNVLEIKNWEGNKFLIEINPKTSIEQISEILKNKNVQIKS